MKPVIRARVPAEKLPQAVPPPYRDAVRKAVDAGCWSLLLFAHAPRDVVHSLPVRKALRRLPERAPDGLLAVGTVFTQEALALLDEAGATVVPLRRSRWTDASARQRQLPDLRPGDLAAAPPAVPLDEGRTAAAAEAGGGGTQDEDDAPALLAAYAGTDYVLDGLDGPLQPGHRHPALDDFLALRGATSLALLTAYNPRSRELPLEENARRQDELRQRLQGAGLRLLPAQGRDPEGRPRPVEPLLAVLDAPAPLLAQLLQDFGQNALVHARAGQAPRLWLLRDFARELAQAPG